MLKLLRLHVIYSFVGAGTLVNRNVPDHALVVGNPSKQIGYVCTCGERLSEGLECLTCSKTYKKDDHGELQETK